MRLRKLWNKLPKCSFLWKICYLLLNLKQFFNIKITLKIYKFLAYICVGGVYHPPRNTRQEKFNNILLKLVILLISNI